MNAATRLTLFAATLVVAFVAAYFIAAAVIPDSFVDTWKERGGGGVHSTEGPEHGDGH